MAEQAMEHGTGDEAPRPVDLRDYLRPLWARKWLILAVVVLATAVTYVYSASQPEVYEASTKVFLQTSQVDELLSEGGQAAADDRTNKTLAAILGSRAVAESAARQLRFRGGPEALQERVEVRPAEGADFITITAEAGSGAGAARLANAFADAFIATRRAAARDQAREARVAAQRRLDRLTKSGGSRATRRSLRSRIQRLEVLETLPAGSAEQVDPARAPAAPAAPRPKRDAAFAFAIALLFGTSLAFALERLDRRIKRIEDVEPLYDAPVLGAVPRLKEPAGAVNGAIALTDESREAFRMLRSNLQLATLDSGLSTILVASAVPSEGKSTILRNLAIAYREAGLRVAVVELDLRRPSLAALFRVEREPGLTEVLVGGNGLGEALQAVAVRDGTPPRDAKGSQPSAGASNGGAAGLGESGQLSILTSGSLPPNPPAVLAAERIWEVLGELKRDHDVVLVDSAPLLAVSDTLPLISRVDGVLVVARLASTRRDAADRFRTTLSRVPDARVLGVVVNDVKSDVGGYLGYDYGYGY